MRKPVPAHGNPCVWPSCGTHVQGLAAEPANRYKGMLAHLSIVHRMTEDEALAQFRTELGRLLPGGDTQT
jgi:hypothetical protein